MDDMIKSLSGRRWHLAHPHSTVACEIVVYVITFVILLRSRGALCSYLGGRKASTYVPIRLSEATHFFLRNFQHRSDVARGFVNTKKNSERIHTTRQSLLVINRWIVYYPLVFHSLNLMVTHLVRVREIGRAHV